MSQAEEKVADTLSKCDEDSKFLQLAKARLSTSSKAFAEYRDEQCTASPEAYQASEAIQERIREHIVATNDMRLFGLLHLLGQASLRMEQVLWPEDDVDRRSRCGQARHGNAVRTGSSAALASAMPWARAGYAFAAPGARLILYKIFPHGAQPVGPSPDAFHDHP